MPTPLPALAGSIVLKAVADLPARLYGGNAQQVEVTGLNYTLHLDLSKLPTSDVTLPAANNWTVVWDADTNTYKRVEFTDLPAPASTLPGPPGIPGPPGGPSTVISGGGIVFSTRSVIPTSTIAAPVLTVQTHGFSTPGDGGHGIYSRMSAPPPNPTNPGFVQSLDGAWWRLVPDGPLLLRAEQFGAKGDYLITDPSWTSASTINPSPTDNHGPIMAAMEFGYSRIGVISGSPPFPNFANGPHIQFGSACYYIGDTLVFDRSVSLQGAGVGFYLSGATTNFFIAAGKSAIRFPVPSNLEAGATNSSVRGIHIESLGKAGQTDKHGIVVQVLVHIEYSAIRGFGGDGIHIAADVGGGTNANLFYLNKVTCYDNAGHGVYCQGGDANAGIGIAISVLGNGGWGIWDKSFLGNTWIGCHADGLNILGSYAAGDSNGHSVWLGCYSESSYYPASQLNSGALVLGGIHAGGIAGDGLYINHKSLSSHNVQYNNGEAGNRITLSELYRPNHIHSTFIDGNLFGSHWVVDPNAGVFGWFHGDVGGAAYYAYSITTEQGIADFGRVDALGPGEIAFTKGCFIGGDQTTGQSYPRKLWYTDKWSWQFAMVGGTYMKPGAYIVGDIALLIRDENLTNDYVGEYCVQTGVYTKQDWVSGGVYDSNPNEPNTYIKNSAGKFYRAMNSPGVPSTVEPTHASGTVTTGDTYQWKWLADQPAIFKRFGNVLGAKSTTVNDPITSLYQTWNNAGVAFAGHTTNIGDTASAASSVLEEWRVNNVVKASVRKDGVFLSNGVPVTLATELDELRDTIAALQDRVATLEAA